MNSDGYLPIRKGNSRSETGRILFPFGCSEVKCLLLIFAADQSESVVRCIIAKKLVSDLHVRVAEIGDVYRMTRLDAPG